MLCPSCGADAGNISIYCPSCGALVGSLSSEEDDYLGQIVAEKYRLEALIGEGGMGKVYRARQLALDKPVVLKVLRQSLLSDERTRARFEREAKAASRLSHPNSISVLDFGTAERTGALFIAMEYVQGKDLHQILSKDWPLAEPRVVRIVSQLLSALSDAHAAGVIHRDLKPENIMVERRRDEADFVKVLDFGIAKIMETSGERSPALTRAGFVCGTPEYMSPEQARGAPLDPRSDLYAVGVLLYQLTTGLLPFEADSAVGFASKHLSEPPLPPSQRRPEARISPGLERLILRALSKDPADRPQTAEAFKVELLASDREQTVTSETPGRPPPAPGENLEDAATRIRQARQPLPGGRWLWFKLATVSLAAISLALAGYYLLRSRTWGASSPRPLPRISPLPAPPLYEVEVPLERRDPQACQTLLRQGDEAHSRGEEELAAAKYQQAFAKDPRPELALKLGELSHQRNDTRMARGFWARHLRDHPRSKAREYIRRAFPDL